MATKNSTSATNAPASPATTPLNGGTAEHATAAPARPAGFIKALNECDRLSQHGCDRILAVARAAKHAVKQAKPFALIEALTLLDMVITEAELLKNDINVVADDHGESAYSEEPTVSAEVFANFRKACAKDQEFRISATEGGAA